MEEVVKANKEKATAEKREKERLRQQAAAAAAGSYAAHAHAHAHAHSGGSGSGGGLNCHHHAMGMAGQYLVAGMHIGGGSDGDLAVVTAGGSRGHLDPPKDRSQLANMRVIRRNLVYAVGLPPSIATEDILKKAEYFGQYGKLSKIVLNRNHNGNGDPRRASASAYVTHGHKEDALACILALDGFYVDGRNIRASYGTSKYCSAFIKNVRCNNPDCTYLHCMGDLEDTFTKQEIQAGYVTSGRDVLARQQQIAAASSGPTARRRVGCGGPSGTGKVAGSPVFPPPTYDEPSKSSSLSSLVAPPPPATSSTTQFPPVGSSMSRSSTTQSIAGFSSVTAGNGVATAGKMSRAASLPGSIPKPEPTLTPAEILSRQQEELRKKHPQNISNKSKVSSSVRSRSQSSGRGSGDDRSVASVPVSVPASTATSAAKSASNSASSVPTPVPIPAPAPAPVPPPATAASVVAGMHSTGRTGVAQPPAPHTTLTALTPLKRTTSLPERNNSKNSALSAKSDLLQNSNAPIPKGLSAAEQAALIEQRKEAFLATNRPPTKETSGSKLSVLRSSSMTLSSNNASGTSSVIDVGASTSLSMNGTSTSSSGVGNASAPRSIGSIGGKVIGGSVPSALPPVTINPIGSSSGGISSLGSIGGQQFENKNTGFGSIGPGSSSLGMDNSFSGQPIGSFGSNSGLDRSNILSQPLMSGAPGKGEWNLGGESKSGVSDGLFGNSDGNFGAVGGIGIWGESSAQNSNMRVEPPMQSQKRNGGAIGGTRLNDMSNSQPIGVPGGGNLFGNSNSFSNDIGGADLQSGSSALASMLGIQLPTGVGSLRETLWASSTPVKGPSEVKMNTPTPIGAGIRKSHDGVIIAGGRPNIIGGGPGGLPIGGYGSSSGPSSGGNNNDFALLQSLLPGVQITGGNAYQPAVPGATAARNHNPFGGPGWSGIGGTQPDHNQQSVGVGGLMPNSNQRSVHQQQPGGESWTNSNGFYSSAPAPQKQTAQKQEHHSNIW